MADEEKTDQATVSLSPTTPPPVTASQSREAPLVAANSASHATADTAKEETEKIEPQSTSASTSDSDGATNPPSQQNCTPTPIPLHLRLWRWQPKPARFDPDNPPKFTVWLNILFGFVRYPLFFVLFLILITDCAGRLLHRVQPLLQSSCALSYSRDVWHQLRKGLIHCNPERAMRRGCYSYVRWATSFHAGRLFSGWLR
jgi:hypothetical protein